MDDSLLILLRGLVYEVEELVEFGRDDDFGAAVALTAEVGGVVGYGVVFAASPAVRREGLTPNLS